jgi:hypothetical protein
MYDVYHQKHENKVPYDYLQNNSILDQNWIVLAFLAFSAFIQVPWK